MITPLPPEGGDITIIDMDARRENRALKSRVEQLERQLVEMSGAVRPALECERGPHGPGCGFHPSVIVDEAAGSVKCRACGDRLDPLLVLLEFARKERNFAYSIMHLREDQKNLREEVEQLKKKRSSLSSQIKIKEKRLR